MTKTNRVFSVVGEASPRFLRLSIAVAVMMAGIALFLASPAQAQVIRGCVQKDSLQVRIIGPTDVCRSTETLVTWNQEGVKGDKGDKGEKGDPGEPGAKGDTGSPGAPGLSGWELVTVTHSLPRKVNCDPCLLEWVQLTAYCPTGKTVLSGSHNYYIGPLPAHEAAAEDHDGVGETFGASGVWTLNVGDSARPLEDGSGWRVYSEVKSSDNDTDPYYHLRVTAICAFVQ